MGTPPRDDEARRAYWIRQMDAAWDFMEAISALPVEECGERLAPLREAAEQARVEVAFSTTLLAGRFERRFYVREGLIPGFLAAAREMNERGWVLKVEDGYRDRAMQKELARAPAVFDVVLRRVIWEHGGRVPRPEDLFRRMSVLVATRPATGTHMSASALDISVLRRDDGAEAPRGAPYLELSELTPLQSPFVADEARRNRREITALMERHGFWAYPFEFWHYSQGDVCAEHLRVPAGRQARYGPVDADLASGRVTPIADRLTPFHTLVEMEHAIAEALRRSFAAHPPESGDDMPTAPELPERRDA